MGGVTDVDRAIATVRALGVDGVEPHGADAIRVLPGGRPVDAVVAALVDAGIGVTQVQRGRHLEEAFLELIGAGEPT